MKNIIKFLIVNIALAFCNSAIADTQLISRMDLLDAWEYNYNASHWFEQANLQNGVQMYGEKEIFITSLPGELAGADWIQTAYGSKYYDRDYVICYFKLKADAELFIIHNDEITEKPLWLKDYKKTDGKVTSSAGDNFSIYKREAKAGELVLLGQNVNIKEEGSKDPNMYIVAVKPLQKLVKDKPAGNIFDVRDFGAVGDGKTMNTKAIQSAIDRCNASGGGIVYISDGVYMSGTLALKDHVTLWVDAGSILRGSQLKSDYPAIRVALLSFRQKEDYQFIFAEKKKDITITGGGIIDGNAIAYNHPWGGPDNNEGERPRLIRMFECENVTVKNITLTRAACWVEYYEACRNMHFETIQVRSYTGVRNLDGLDLSGCSDVVVKDFTAICGDDAICIKAMSMVPGENIDIDGLFSRYANCNLFKIGTETHSAVRNLHLKNARGWTRYTVAVEAVDGATVENITLENIEMYTCAAPFFVRLGARGRTFEGGPDSAPIGKIKNVTLRNIKNTDISFVPDKAGPGVGAPAGGLINHPIENLTIEDCDFILFGSKLSKDAIYREIPENEQAYPEFHTFGVLPSYGMYFRHIDGLKVKNVRLRLKNEDIRPAVILDDVKNYSLQGIEYESYPGMEPFGIWHKQDGEIQCK